MAARLTGTIEKANEERTHMVSPHVSDSEDELGDENSWHISTQKLQQLLHKRIRADGSFLPKITVSLF